MITKEKAIMLINEMLDKVDVEIKEFGEEHDVSIDPKEVLKVFVKDDLQYRDLAFCKGLMQVLIMGIEQIERQKWGIENEEKY